MASSTSNCSENVQPHVLCAFCKLICEQSVCIRTYAAYGDSKGFGACVRFIDWPEEWPFHSINSLQKSSDHGCHLCSLFFEERYRRNPQLLQRLEGKEDTLNLPCRLEIGPEFYHNFQLDSSLALMLSSQTDSIRLKGFVASPSTETYPDLNFAIQVSRRTTAENAAEIIRFWLNECSENHSFCNSNYAKNFHPSFRPTRLLDVFDLDHPRLDTGESPESQNVEFLTLSHCWGNGTFLKLQNRNIADMIREIPADRLSQTFRDAMAITKALGYRYLWIDALCIIQDSKEDWFKEVHLMAKVYAHSVVNLAACGPSSDTGCFETRNPLCLLPCKLSTQGGQHFYAHSPNAGLPNDLPLFTRAWAVQERLLSRRNVYFRAQQLYWECFDQVAAEAHLRCQYIGSDLFTREKSMYSYLLKNFEGLNDLQLHEMPGSLIQFARHWNGLISRLSQKKLTIPSDKLATLAGIASIIVERTSLNYVGGMWKELLPGTLLWRRSLDGKPKTRPGWRGAPSWSWTSIDCSIHYSDLHKRYPALLECRTQKRRPGLVECSSYFAEIVDCHVIQVPGQPKILGEVAEGKIHIIGILRRVQKWIVVDKTASGGCGWQCSGSHAMFSGSEAPVDFNPDVQISEYEPLFFFTLYRGSVSCSVLVEEQDTEQGLVLAQHRDGFIRMGCWEIIHSNQDVRGLLWGGGQVETILIY
ncbi:uncharacterized protein PAC_18011 [Phialocephala subalpina]|uniref:Heterokaryon incompatibility domain-containing protein n=1 Tax=Phialocephala subalpina TaxID=576137 RepID=A0A1L7XSU1_9HELO|nr:uncharacterized protein PAC_18011 [Phialocephala subalpina]